MILSPLPPLSQHMQFVSASSMSSSLCMAMRAASPLPPPLIPISSQRSPRFTTVSSPSFQSRRFHFRRLAVVNNQKVDRSREAEEKGEAEELFLYSVAPLPLVAIAALPGADFLRSLCGPFVELVKSWNLPEWLVQWGHPGNMAVVLFAMGGYGTYLGFRIRYSDNPEEKAKAKDLHPKLLGGMFFFFALGATGGITSLLTQDKPIFESPHSVTGLIGLALLTVQTVLPALFEENPGLRNVHGILGSSIMGLFFIHAALGLQLGLAS